MVRFPGEDAINVMSDARSPYADDPPTLVESFGYRGQGLSGDQQVANGANALLERARVGGEPVRFWYKPLAEPFTFLSWAVVIGRGWIPGVGQDLKPRVEIDWRLEAVPSPLSGEWPGAVSAAVKEAGASTEDNPGVPKARASVSYEQLLARVAERGQPRRPSGQVRIDFPRSIAAKRAVLIRAKGNCENPRCSGMPAEPNRRGEPILDVDHIQDLALGGDDHPLNMIAMCPNCHAVKTRGSNANRQRKYLLNVAKAAHEASLARGVRGVRSDNLPE